MDHYDLRINILKPSSKQPPYTFLHSKNAKHNCYNLLCNTVTRIIFESRNDNYEHCKLCRWHLPASLVTPLRFQKSQVAHPDIVDVRSLYFSGFSPRTGLLLCLLYRRNLLTSLFCRIYPNKCNATLECIAKLSPGL